MKDYSNVGIEGFASPPKPVASPSLEIYGGLDEDLEDLHKDYEERRHQAPSWSPISPQQPQISPQPSPQLPRIARGGSMVEQLPGLEELGLMELGLWRVDEGVYQTFERIPSLREKGLDIYLGADKGVVARALGLDFWSVVS
ncbi:hypothetical protein P7C71_g903, partial [Lecanoromycetidae sp. Uapishka_2]